MDPKPPRAAEIAIDARSFWWAVSARATGYAVVTAEDAGGPAGFLGLSATHLCDQPPMMMVSIGAQTTALKTVIASRHFAINYLAEGDTALADSFGGKGEEKGADRFVAARWTRLTTGAPVLRDAVGVLDCMLEETLERHGTFLAIGRLVNFSVRADLRPLVKFLGQPL
jgi:flavin reductase (DIM6/NTAB) family NADH-FMN oxidoreductase RutF